MKNRPLGAVRRPASAVYFDPVNFAEDSVVLTVLRDAVTAGRGRLTQTGDITRQSCTTKQWRRTLEGVAADIWSLMVLGYLDV